MTPFCLVLQVVHVPLGLHYEQSLGQSAGLGLIVKELIAVIGVIKGATIFMHFVAKNRKVFV